MIRLAAEYAPRSIQLEGAGNPDCGVSGDTGRDRCVEIVPRTWHPTVTLETGHHLIYSTATHQQTEETAWRLEVLYQAYSDRLGDLKTLNTAHQKLKVKLLKDRA